MITRYTCSLNGIELGHLDPSILLLDIRYTAPVRTLTTTQLAGRDGQRLMRTTTSSVSVSLTFEIHEQDIQRRFAVCEKVQQWAMEGGLLTTGDRPERQLHVVCETPPVIGSSLKWTDRLGVTLTAFDRPFWEDRFPTTVSLSGNTSRSVYAPGFAAPAMVEGSVTNQGTGPIQQVDITAGETAFHFTGLGLTAGQKLTFDYDEHGILSIRVGSTSALDKRTPLSSDDLTLIPGGMRTVSVHTDGSALTRLDIRGRYL